MRTESYDLLIDADLVGKYGDLGKKPSLIGSVVSEYLLYPCIDLLPVLINDPGRSFLDEINDGKEVVQLGDEVLNKILTLSGPCLDHLLACSVNGLLKSGPEFILIIGFLNDFEHIGEACESCRTQVILKSEFLGYLFYECGILGSELMVILKLSLGFRKILKGNIDINLAAA